MTENLYTPDSIRTVGGRYVNLLEPDPDTIHIEDIAHALSHMPRFGGHLKTFHSVAAHSMAVAGCVPAKHRLEALLHDASEAYLIDVPSPLKQHLPQYKIIENRMMRVIAIKFGCPWPMHEAVKTADRVVLEREWHLFMLGGIAENYADEAILAVSHQDRKAMAEEFLFLFNSLQATT